MIRWLFASSTPTAVTVSFSAFLSLSMRWSPLPSPLESFSTDRDWLEDRQNPHSHARLVYRSDDQGLICQLYSYGGHGPAQLYRSLILPTWSHLLHPRPMHRN